MATNSGEILAALQREYRAINPALGKVGGEVVNAIQSALSIPYPPQSAPGAFPHARSGALRSSYSWQLRGDHTVRVSSDVEHSVYLELGTRKMAERPHLHPIMETVGRTAILKHVRGDMAKAARG